MNRRLLERLRLYITAWYVDTRLFLAGKQDRDLPPLRLRAVGAGDFRAMGLELVQLLVEYGDISPSSRLLDIGCGAGRVAIPLARYVRDGTYDGFDVSRRSIRWCKQHIGRRNANFKFHHVRLRNSEYSPTGRAADQYAFPFADATFDCVFAFSVFTHLNPEETRQYLRESARVLKPGGRLLGTFFLLNAQSIPRLPDLGPLFRFPIERGLVRLANSDNPAEAVAIDEAALAAMISDSGFPAHRIVRGQWTGLVPGPTFQDMVICEKPILPVNNPFSA